MRKKVVDLRTGAVHPVRGWSGRFISYREAAEQVRLLDRNLRVRELSPDQWRDVAAIWKRLGR